MRTCKMLRVWFLCASLGPAGGLAAAEAVDFSRDVAPVFVNHCLRCHQPANKKGAVSLATRDDLVTDGHVLPGKPDESPLLELVTPGSDGRAQMPKEGPPLSPAQIATLRNWIAAGATWPAGVVLQERAKADKSWWSLRPLSDVPPPATPGLPAAWQASPIDRWVFANMAAKGLSPSPPADRRTLLRRVTYDLTGLPPTPEELAAFVADPTPMAYEKVVDRLLASPRYGEHWGRHWLDVVRFGESNGFERNVTINNAWPFRDYVIRSFQEDKPFDQLVCEHLAGDVVGAGQPDVEVATTFLVCGPYDNVGNQDAAQAAVIRADTLDDLVRAVGETFLGYTVGCARCHGHKFDPLPQQDYYRLYATLAGVFHGERPWATAAAQQERAAKLQPLQAAQERLTKERAEAQKTLATAEPAARQRISELDRELSEVQRQLAAVPPLPTCWSGQFRQVNGPFPVFLGGDPQRKGEPVVPASLSLLSEVVPAYQLPADAPDGARRLALAKWLVAAENPLTPRVLVNRLWHYHFGTGIVDTPSDFGYMGGRPTHPELLDWLAGQLRSHGWKLKPLHRLIVLSQAYQQAATYREDAGRIDGDSRYLWRFPPRRLTAEELRDTLLAVAGQLDTRQGGPGFRLYRYVEDNVATYVPLDEQGPDTYRRAVYHQNARASRVDVLSDFDCPDPALAAPRRAATTTPLQALTLLNHRFSLEMARFLAERIQREAAAGGVPAEIERAFRLAFARPPTRDEAEAAQRLLEQRGRRAFCRALLNANELLYLQ